MLFWLSIILLLCCMLMLVIYYGVKLKKTNNDKNDKGNIKRDLDKFKVIFQSNSNKKVLIEKMDIKESFNRFPFLSEFKEIEKKYPSEILINSLKHVEKSFYNYWASKEFDFFIIFENLSKNNYVIFSSESLIKIYNEFSTETFQIYKKTFINEVIPAIIYKYENKSYNLIDPQNLNEYIDEIFIDFSKAIDKLIETIDLTIHKGKSNSEHAKSVVQNDSALIKAYRTLEVSPMDSNEEIKKSYLKLAKLYHPDKNKKDFAKQKMVEINDAYDVILKDRKIK
ncbi:J domain-containing protein [Spiroplasma diminutum]|uniref:J domain-containing protein n=1 Tax=Spiroplasma diminutum CUAS-1 TaxID=1276221 RepID=S5MDX6_9MOLU|nr:DnaJ domain-containing protein [Spiroplasma diminutum]AGR41923.1 hypothetical protein SDIMI_v3c02190 [Spiroplasma diminutum CUAS-1]